MTKVINRSKPGSCAKHLSSNRIQEILMILPMTIGFLLFSVSPIIWVIRWSCFNYNGFSTPVWCGLDNFIRILTRDPAYWNSLLNTFIIAGLKMLVEIPMALILAVLVNNARLRGGKLFRVVFFLPSVFSIAVVGLIFSILFSAFNGIVNAVLWELGIINRNISWFGDKTHAMFVIILVSLWTTFGLNMIYFLMGLQNIPKSLYECASIDGASPLRQFFSITVPLLSPILQLVLMRSGNDEDDGLDSGADQRRPRRYNGSCDDLHLQVFLLLRRQRRARRTVWLCIRDGSRYRGYPRHYDADLPACLPQNAEL